MANIVQYRRVDKKSTWKNFEVCKHPVSSLKVASGILRIMYEDHLLPFMELRLITTDKDEAKEK